MTDRMTLVQARVSSTAARQLDNDVRTLGLASRSDAVRAALRLLHRDAVDAALMQEFDACYGPGAQAPASDLAAIGDEIAAGAIANRDATQVFRGDVWDVHFPAPIGARPCVLLTRNVLIERLGAVTVAEITGTPGPPTTHIEIGTEAGLTGRDQSWVNVTGLHTVAKGKLRKQRGRLAPAELRHVSRAVRTVLDLADDDQFSGPSD